MNLRPLYADRTRLRFDLGPPLHDAHDFEYARCEDDSIELFYKNEDSVPFMDWNAELWPPDPRYGDPGERLPLLHAAFPALNVYDEQVLNFLLYTLNATLSLPPLAPSHAMNERMKQYAFFRLANLPDPTAMNQEGRTALREFLFWFYLYAHPVNGETLEAFSFREADTESDRERPTLIHTASGISVRAYIEAYHDDYAKPLADFEDKLAYTPKAIESCRTLTLQLLDALEGRSDAANKPMLPSLPERPEWDMVIGWLNTPSELLKVYTDDRAAVFETLRLLLSDSGQPSADGSTLERGPYREHLAAMLLDDYACCILQFDPDELLPLIAYFETEPMLLKQIVNRLFTGTIFLQKIGRQHAMDWAARYPQIAELLHRKR